MEKTEVFRDPFKPQYGEPIKTTISGGPQKSHHCSGGRSFPLCVLASDICQLRTAGSVLRTLQIPGLLLELWYDRPWWASSLLPSPGSLWSPNLQTCLSSISLWTLWRPTLAPCSTLSAGPGPTFVATFPISKSIYSGKWQPRSFLTVS